MTVSSRTKVAREEALMKFDGESTEIFAADDLTGSLRAAAELTGCSHHTVARHVGLGRIPYVSAGGPCLQGLEPGSRRPRVVLPEVDGVTTSATLRPGWCLWLR